MDGCGFSKSLISSVGSFISQSKWRGSLLVHWVAFVFQITAAVQHWEHLFELLPTPIGHMVVLPDGRCTIHSRIRIGSDVWGVRGESAAHCLVSSSDTGWPTATFSLPRRTLPTTSTPCSCVTGTSGRSKVTKRRRAASGPWEPLWGVTCARSCSWCCITSSWWPSAAQPHW